MNIFQQYGIKEVADVCFYSIEEDENDDEVYVPVLYLDTLKVSTIEQTSSDVAARGGLGNPKLIVWDFGKEITLTLEDALYSPASMSMVWGDKLKVKPFTLNGYITHYEALDLDEYSVDNKTKDKVNDTILEDEPPHVVGSTGIFFIDGAVTLDEGENDATWTDVKRVIKNHNLTVNFQYDTKKVDQQGNKITKVIEDINVSNIFIPNEEKVMKNADGHTYHWGGVYYTGDTTDKEYLMSGDDIDATNYDMNGGNLTDARLTITKFGNFEMTPSSLDTNANDLREFVWLNCEGYIKSKNNKYQYSFKHCKLCYAQDAEWNTGMRGKWYVKIGDDEGMKDGYATPLNYSTMTQFAMTTYDSLTGKPQKVICNFFPDDLFIHSYVVKQYGAATTDEDGNIVTPSGYESNNTYSQLSKQEYAYLSDKIAYRGLSGFNPDAIMYRKYNEYSDEQFKGMEEVTVSDWMKYLTDRNESLIPPQECIYLIDHAIDNVFYLDRIEKCKATQTFAIDTNLNTLEANWRYLPAYKLTELTVYIDPKTMQPYEPNTNIFYRRNGDAWYGYDLTAIVDSEENGHYDYTLTPNVVNEWSEDSPYNIKVFKQYEIYYKWTRTRAAENTSLGKQIIVDAAHFPGTYKIVGECYSRSRETGKDERFQFEIPLAKVKANLESITLQAEGDPTTFTMEIDVLRPENGEMMKLTQYNVVRSEYPLDYYGDPRKKQKSGATEIVSEDLVTPEDPFEESNLDDDGSVSPSTRETSGAERNIRN